MILTRGPRPHGPAAHRALGWLEVKSLCFRVIWEKSNGVHLREDTIVHSAPLPGSGAILAFILSILKHFEISPEEDISLLAHRMTEAFKWAYAKRAELGDPTDPDITEEIHEV